MHELIRLTVRRAVVPLALAVTAVTAVSAEPVAAASQDQECASLEDCYSYDDMDDFLDVAEKLVRDFVHARYLPELLWVDVRFVAEGESEESLCLERPGVRARYTEHSYEYCPADNTINIGQKTLWSFYSEIGDVAPIVGLAHEFGHFVQSAHKIPGPQTPEESIHHENQADCFAGAWFAYADATGHVERPDDLEDIDLILARIGSSESDKGRTHGTPGERKRSFQEGRIGGLKACNVYYPGTPLHSEEEREKWRAMLVELQRPFSSAEPRRPPDAVDNQHRWQRSRARRRPAGMVARLESRPHLAGLDLTAENSDEHIATIRPRRQPIHGSHS